MTEPTEIFERGVMSKEEFLAAAGFPKEQGLAWKVWAKFVQAAVWLIFAIVAINAAHGLFVGCRWVWGWWG